MKFTPGPWEIFNGKLIMATDPSFGCIATCHLNSSGDEPETLEANAKLIAAAPDLLGALKDFVSVCETAPPIELIKMIGESCAKAKQAIKQAEA